MIEIMKVVVKKKKEKKGRDERKLKREGKG